MPKAKSRRSAAKTIWRNERCWRARRGMFMTKRRSERHRRKRRRAGEKKAAGGEAPCGARGRKGCRFFDADPAPGEENGRLSVDREKTAASSVERQGLARRKGRAPPKAPRAKPERGPRKRAPRAGERRGVLFAEPEAEAQIETEPEKRRPRRNRMPRRRGGGRRERKPTRRQRPSPGGRERSRSASSSRRTVTFSDSTACPRRFSPRSRKRSTTLSTRARSGDPPDILVEIRELAEDRFRVVVGDSGPGIVKAQVPKIFGKLLYGRSSTCSNRREDSRASGFPRR